jgi:DNA invertase Pin-like site-specific DNA recombinase
LAEARCEKVFIDKVSGKLARRPRWDACLDYMRPGDQLVVTRLSPVARSVQHLTEVAAELEHREVHLDVLASVPAQSTTRSNASPRCRPATSAGQVEHPTTPECWAPAASR